MNERMPTPVVRELNSLRVTGNVVPEWWVQHIRGSARSGGDKPNLLAAYILAEVRYWHTLMPIEDPDAGRVVDWQRKFAAPVWQQSYETIANRLGYSPRQVKDACLLLVEYGLVGLLFHHVRLASGAVIPNRMFILPIPSRIRWITETDPAVMRLARMEIVSVNVPPPPAYDHKWSGGVARYGDKVSPEMVRWYGHLWSGALTINGTNTEITTQRAQSQEHNPETPHDDDAGLSDEADTSLRSVSATRARAGGNANYPAPVLDGPDDGGDEDDDEGVNVGRIKVLQAYCLARMPLVFTGFDAPKKYVSAMSLGELERCAQWIWFVHQTGKKVEPGFLRYAMESGETPQLDGAKGKKSKVNYDIFADVPSDALTWEDWEKDVAEFEYGVGF